MITRVQKTQKQIEEEKNKRIQYLIKSKTNEGNILKKLVEENRLYHLIICAIKVITMTPNKITINEIEKYTGFFDCKIRRTMKNLVTLGLMNQDRTLKHYTYSLANPLLFEQLVNIADQNKDKFLPENEILPYPKG
jgi:hypothetical protein